MTKVEDQSKPVTRKRFWRRLGIFLIIACVLLLLLYTQRIYIFEFLGSHLISDDSAKQNDMIIFFDGAVGNLAANLKNRPEVPDEIYVLDGSPARTQQLRIHPLTSEAIAKELKFAGLTDVKIKSITCEGYREADRIRSLAQWLEKHPNQTVGLLVERLQSTRLRQKLGHFLSESDNQRINLLTIKHPLTDETNWWKSREGQLSVFDTYLRYGYFSIFGDDGKTWLSLPPEKYEQFVLKGSQ